MSLLHDATVCGDIHFYDVCKVADSVTIAHNNVVGKFEVDHEQQIIVEYPAIPVDGWYSSIPHHWEIIKTFLDRYSLTPTWVDNQGITGVLDEETGSWTGAVGKVGNYCFCYNSIPILFRLKGMRQTGLCMDLPAPMAEARLLCVLMLLCSSPSTGGRDIPRRQQSIGTSPTCFTLRPGCGHS